MAAPRAAEDDELRVGERDDGGEDPGDGLAEDATRGRRPCARAVTRAASSRSTSIAVEPGVAQAELAETSVNGIARPVRAGREQVGDLAGQAARGRGGPRRR